MRKLLWILSQRTGIMTLCFPVIMTFAFLNAHADCSITSNLSASGWSSSGYASCTGIITIESGATLLMDANLTLPSLITELVVADGGHIRFVGGKELHLDPSTILTIKNTDITDPQNPQSALYAPNQGGGACNNNTSIYLGTLKYSACTGGGNVCLTFVPLMAQGGSLKITAGAEVEGADMNNNSICTSTADNLDFNINAALTQNSQLSNPPTVQWSVSGMPAGAAAPTIHTPNDTTTAVTTYAAGNYVFAFQVTQNLSTADCQTNQQQIKTVYLPVTVVENPTTAISVGDTLYANSNPATHAVIDMSGQGGEGQYTIWYTLNGNPQVPVTTAGGNYTITIPDTDPVGTYNFEITKIADTVCGVQDVSNVMSTVEIISSPLAIQLLSFEARETNCQVFINWKCADDADVEYYEVERSGRDENNFQPIAKLYVQTDGQYSFIDRNMPSKALLYRLKIRERTGISYSAIVKVENGCAAAAPTCRLNEQGQVIIDGMSGRSRIGIFSMSGTPLNVLNTANASESVDIQNYANGIYLLVVTDSNGKAHTFRIVKR